MEKIDYQIFKNKILHNVWNNLQYLETHIKMKSVSLSWLKKIFWKNLILSRLYFQTLLQAYLAFTPLIQDGSLIYANYADLSWWGDPAVHYR